MKMTFVEGSAVIEGDEKAACRKNGFVIDYMYYAFNICARLVRTGNARVASSFNLDRGEGERSQRREKRTVPYVEFVHCPCWSCYPYTRDEARGSATDSSKTRSHNPGNCKFVGNQELERSRWRPDCSARGLDAEIQNPR